MNRIFCLNRIIHNWHNNVSIRYLTEYLVFLLGSVSAELRFRSLLHHWIPPLISTLSLTVPLWVWGWVGRSAAAGMQFLRIENLQFKWSPAAVAHTLYRALANRGNGRAAASNPWFFRAKLLGRCNPLLTNAVLVPRWIVLIEQCDCPPSNLLGQRRVYFARDTIDSWFQPLWHFPCFSREWTETGEREIFSLKNAVTESLNCVSRSTRMKSLAR